jgi:hypothetical protein
MRRGDGPLPSPNHLPFFRRHSVLPRPSGRPRFPRRCGDSTPRPRHARHARRRRHALSARQNATCASCAALPRAGRRDRAARCRTRESHAVRRSIRPRAACAECAMRRACRRERSRRTRPRVAQDASPSRAEPLDPGLGLISLGFSSRGTDIPARRLLRPEDESRVADDASQTGTSVPPNHGHECPFHGRGGPRTKTSRSLAGRARRSRCGRPARRAMLSSPPRSAAARAVGPAPPSDPFAREAPP